MAERSAGLGAEEYDDLSATGLPPETKAET